MISLPSTPSVVSKEEGVADRNDSAAWSANDQFGIPDDNDALGRCPLCGGLSIGHLLACRCGASDEDKSVADHCLVHGGPCTGDGQADFSFQCAEGQIVCQEASGPVGRR